MEEETDNKPLADRIRSALPEALSADETIAREIEQVANLESQLAETKQNAAMQRAFLERAPKEGLRYVSDALELADLQGALKDATDVEAAIDGLYSTLRATRPYLFAKPQESPANEKIVPTDRPDLERMREALKRSSSSRNIQNLRDAMRRRPIR